MEIDFSALLKVFLAESEERIWAAEEALLSLERDPSDGEALAEIFRVVHTVKGDAGTLALSELAGFSNSMEDVVDAVRGGDLELDRSLVSLLLEGVDALRAMLADAGAGIDELNSTPCSRMLQRQRTY